MGRLILGTDTTGMDTGHTDMDITDMGTDMATTMERDLLMLSPLPKPLPTLRPRLILGTDTGHMDTDIMGTDTMATMERDLLRLSQLPMLLPTLRLILGTDTTDTLTGHMDIMDMDTMATHTTTMERGLLMLSQRPKPLPTLRLRLILGTDTTDMDTGHTDMDTMDTAHTDMLTGVKLKPTTTCCFSLPTLL